MNSHPVAIFTANRGYALFSSRRNIIRRFLDRNWTVVIVTADDEYAHRLVADGCILEPLYVHRSGASMVHDMVMFGRLFQIYRRYRPRFIHHFHSKPVIIGTLASRLARGFRVRVVNTITGLGHAFIRGGFIRTIVGWGYGISLSLASRVIFQNRDDQRLFLAHRWVSKRRAELIVGSGVDIKRFTPKGKNGKPLTVLYVGRLLYQKGVVEYLEMVAGLKTRGVRVRCLLVGESDPVHADSIPEATLDDLIQRSGVEYLGYVTDMPSLLAETDLMVLPSYREGVPRVILEAAACGIPSLGADVPGIRETIIHGETGYLVPVRNVADLIDKAARLLDDDVLRRRMGQAAWKRVTAFSMERVVTRYMDLYRKIGVWV